MTVEQAKTEFYARLKKAGPLGAAISMLHWDMETIIPPKARKTRGEVIGALSAEHFALLTAPQFGEALNTMNDNPSALTAEERRMVQLALHDYNREKNIPAQLYEEYVIARASSNNAWRDAKERDDYAAFQPHLQKMIDYHRRFGEYWGYSGQPYNAQLEGYDPDAATARLNPVFEQLLAGTRRLMARLPGAGHVALPAVPEAGQAALARWLLEEMHFDLEAGLLATTEHPFTIAIHADDVRLTTHYYENDPASSIFSALHEGGHGLYDQGINPQYDGTPLANAFMSIHESQSRFWENLVGRSLAFWESRFETACQVCGVRLAASPRAMWKSINRMQPSLVRTEADELTYNLHIIIRYELEQMMFNEGLNADRLPAVWNEKYREYLGIAPPTNALGLMQDIHWGEGLFGYFPSYSLGNLYAAQFAAALEKQKGSLDSLIRKPGGLGEIRAWQLENIHRHGALETPEQLATRVCGEGLNPSHFLAIMEAKLNALAV